MTKRFLERRDRGLLVNDFQFFQVSRQINNRFTNRILIFAFGGFFNGPADLAQVIEPVSPAGAFHGVTEDGNRIEIALFQSLLIYQQVAFPVFQLAGNQILQIRVHANPDFI